MKIYRKVQIREVLRALDRFRWYYRFGSWVCVLDELFGRELVRTIRIRGTNVYVRTNTADLNVAIAGLFYKEYDHIRCPNPTLIIDAGANIGTSAVFFAQKYPGARVLAVEPEESNFDLLLKNTQNYRNVVAIRAAVWGVHDRRTIHDRHTGHWGYTVSETPSNAGSTGQQIDCVTVSSLIEEYGIRRVDLLKMDIEGSEKSVLENSSTWIDAVDIMTVELHDRICMGCTRAFYLATKDFKNFEKHGEKITAYRN